jgi:HEAT repeat protein
MKRVLICVGLTLLIAVSVCMIIPSSRTVVVGYLNQERMFQSKPTSYWTRAMTDRQPGTSDAAYQELKDGGADALPMLLEAMREQDPARRVAAAKAISAYGKEAVPALTELLHDERPTVRSNAARALRDMGPQARAAVPALTSAVHDEAISVAILSMDALVKIGGPDAVQTLVAALKDRRDINIRSLALVGLGRQGRDGRPAVPYLVDDLQRNRTVRDREETARCLKAIDPELAGKLGIE